jgi:elongation factor Ts
MHIAATSPVSISREEVPAEVIAREKEIYVQQALDSGKPEAIVEKMVSGKIEKFLAEIVLLEQKFVKNPDLTIQDILNELVGRIGENISIKRFARFQIGVE